MKDPKRVGDLVSAIIAKYRIGEVSAKRELELAFRAVVDPRFLHYCRLGQFRRNVLEVLVSNPIALQELSMFHGPKLRDDLNTRLKSVSVKELKFRRG